MAPMNGVELLSPAGDLDTAIAAFAAGADAVYCGLQDYSARAFAKNLSTDDLKLLVRFARPRGKKVYVAFNTLVDEDSIDGAVRTLAELEEIAPSALIVQDLGVARICREYFPSLALHASTQLVCHNLEGAVALRDLGFRRAVLARELSLREISYIARRAGGFELEAFVHGALCYSVSGLCLFSAMEKGRSGNRGRCAYCCRLAHRTADGGTRLPFSMKDLSLGPDALRLAEAGVSSLKIEGRMKSALYVAGVTSFYRRILDGAEGGVSSEDLETVFSRRTTRLYIDGRDAAGEVTDPVSLGHLGARIGEVKRVTRDREGRAWLRFHTSRALEKHDGIQFERRGDGETPPGFGISSMRLAISRTPVFEAPAGSDVEILLPEDGGFDFAAALRPGEGVYCSMSNAVKRMFPAPSFRPADCPGTERIDVEVSISAREISASAKGVPPSAPFAASAAVSGAFERARNPLETARAVEKAFSKLGGTDYALRSAAVADPDALFAPPGILNELRRRLVSALDGARAKTRLAHEEAALADDATAPDSAASAAKAMRNVKIAAGAEVPQGAWDEVIVAVDAATDPHSLPPPGAASAADVRLALPVYTPEPEFARLRGAVKRLLRAGYRKWEAADLATLSMLKRLGAEDVTADWTLYAFNASALKLLSGLGARRFVASPENGRGNLAFLAESGYAVEFLAQQSTPLFVSLARPAAELAPESEFATYARHGLWITVRKTPRTFETPAGACVRYDLSWSPS